MEEEGFETVRLMPLLSNPARSGVPGGGERVAEIAWNEGRFITTGDMAERQEFLAAIAERDGERRPKFILDVAGVNGGEADFAGLKRSLRRGGPYWLEAGAADVEDVFDVLTLDPDVALIGTLRLDGMDLYADAIEVSEICVPVLYIEGGRVRFRRRRMDVLAASSELRGMGYERCVLFDAASAGRSIDRDLWRTLHRGDWEAFAAGGITETDIPFLSREGYAGAAIDPYIPSRRPHDEGLRPLETEFSFKSPAPSGSWSGV